MGKDRRRKNSERLSDERSYLEQLRDYRNQGIPILINGDPIPQEKEWFRIFEVREDGAVYMPDFVDQDGRVAAINFDLVYPDQEAKRAWQHKKTLEEAARKAQLEFYEARVRELQRQMMLSLTREERDEWNLKLRRTKAERERLGRSEEDGVVSLRDPYNTK